MFPEARSEPENTKPDSLTSKTKVVYRVFHQSSRLHAQLDCSRMLHAQCVFFTPCHQHGVLETHTASIVFKKIVMSVAQVYIPSILENDVGSDRAQSISLIQGYEFSLP